MVYFGALYKKKEEWSNCQQNVPPWSQLRTILPLLWTPPDHKFHRATTNFKCLRAIFCCDSSATSLHSSHSKLHSQILPHCGIKRRYLASLLTPRLCKALRAHWPSPAMILFRTSTVSTRNVFVTIYNPTRVNHTSGHIHVACPKILHHVAGV